MAQAATAPRRPPHLHRGIDPLEICDAEFRLLEGTIERRTNLGAGIYLVDARADQR